MLKKGLITTFALVALGVAACSTKGNQSVTQSTAVGDDQAVAAMQDVILHGPQWLVDKLKEGDTKNAKLIARSLYQTWQGISPDSSLYNAEFAQKVCADGMRFACGSLRSSQDALSKLYNGFAFGDDLSQEEVGQLAQEILGHSAEE